MYWSKQQTKGKNMSLIKTLKKDIKTIEDFIQKLKKNQKENAEVDNRGHISKHRKHVRQLKTRLNFEEGK